MKVSVIVPVYNVEPYLRQCLDSILNQTYTNLEIILVNDGSTDSSGRICEEYKAKDSRIRLIHKENGGLSSARNVGLDVATGDFLNFVDSDDWLTDTAIEVLVTNQKKSGSDVVVTNYIFYEEAISNFTFYPRDYADGFTKTYSVEEWFCHYGHNDLRTSDREAVCKLYKKSLFDHIRYPEGKINEDVWTTYKAYLLANHITYINTTTYLYRKREGSITLSSDYEKRGIKSLLDAYEHKFFLLAANGIDMYKGNDFNEYMYHLHRAKDIALEYGDITLYRESSLKLEVFERFKDRK